jgi:hypothetical protein
MSQTRSEVLPASYPVVTEGKARLWSDADHSALYFRRQEWVEPIAPLPHDACMAVAT